MTKPESEQQPEQDTIHLCELGGPPSDGLACLWMVWSYGKACRECPRHDCPNQGQRV